MEAHHRARLLEAQRICPPELLSNDAQSPICLTADGCQIDRSRNLAGFCRRSFTLSKDQGTRQIILRFEDVGAFAQVWVNGTYVGMAKGSSAPAEFDITAAVRPERNVVCVQLLRWSDASCLASGEGWLPSGLLGDVTLYSLPSRRITDIRCALHIPAPEQKELHVSLKFQGADGFAARIALMDGASVVGYCQTPITGDEAKAVIPCPDAALWTAQTPKLYRIAVILWDGLAMYHTRQITIGLRQVRLEDALLLNGKPEKLFGVHYHPVDPETGCALCPEKLEQELRLVRDHNFNAIHLTVPAPEALYEICDRIGLYILDGSAPAAPKRCWQEQVSLAHSRHAAFRGFHPSILAWNYDTACDHILPMPRLERLENPVLPRLNGLTGSGDFPLLLTCAGVPVEELEQLVVLIRSNRQLIGGIFGTFRDRTFLGAAVPGAPEGLCDRNGTLRGSIRAASAMFQPISMDFDQGRLTIQNHSPYRSTGALDCRYHLTRDGEPIVTKPLSLDAAPGGTASLEIETKYDIYRSGRYHLSVEFSEKTDGRVIARGQWPVAQLRHIYDENPGGAIREDGGSILLRAQDSAFIINRATGSLEQLRLKDTELLAGAACPVYIDPRERSSGLRLPNEWERLSARKKKPKPAVLEVDHMTRTVTASFHLGSGLMQTYRLHSDGSLAVELRLRTGRTAPDLLGLWLPMKGVGYTLSWFGLGPDDAKNGCCPGGFYGLHSQSIGTLPCEGKAPVYTMKLAVPGQGGIRIRSEEGLRAGVLPGSGETILTLELPTRDLKPHTTYFFSFTILPE